MKNFPLVVLASLALASCATTAEYANKAVEYGKQAGFWIGQKVESLYASEGEPSAVKPQADGGKIVEYRHPAAVEPVPAAATADSAAASASATTPSPGTHVVPCTTRYKVDSSGTIRSWTIDGKGCKAVEVEATPRP